MCVGLILFFYQRFGGLHPHHPGTVTDHVTDLPKCIINQSDLLIGRWDRHNADWTYRTLNKKSAKATKSWCSQSVCKGHQSNLFSNHFFLFHYPFISFYFQYFSSGDSYRHDTESYTRLLWRYISFLQLLCQFCSHTDSKSL